MLHEMTVLRILRYISPPLGGAIFIFVAQITGFREKFSNPQGGKSKDFSAGKCHLLDFIVVLESSFGFRKITKNFFFGITKGSFRACLSWLKT